MTGNFTNNPVIKYLPHVVKYKLTNSEYIDKNGFFIGNFPKDLTFQLNRLKEILNKII